MSTEPRVKCLACNGYGGDGGQADNGTWEWPCEVCGGRRTVTAREQLDAQVQSMRDQGIADACAGRAARYYFDEDGTLCESGFNEWLVERIPQDAAEYRSAFAYARAYEANK